MFKTFWNGVKDLGGSLVEGVGDFAGGLVRGVGSLAEGVADFVGGAIKAGAGALGDAIGGPIGDAISWVGDTVAAPIEAAGTLAGGAGDIIGTAVEGVAGVASSVLKLDLGNAISDAVQTVADVFESAISTAVTATMDIVDGYIPGDVGLASTASSASDGPSLGTDGDDELSGNEEANWIQAGSGDDVVDGRGGDDLIEGQGGDDILIGGQGNDTLDGGEGLDVYVFTADSGHDQIQEFDQDDRILLSEEIASGDLTGEYDTETDATTLSWDVNGVEGSVQMDGELDPNTQLGTFDPEQI